MRLHKVIVLLMVACVSFGCSRKPVLAEAQPEASSEDPGSKIDVKGDKLIFAEGAPQLASLNVEICKPRADMVLHFNGRLVWDEDLTVNVFTPVGGHVKNILAKLGDNVTVGTPLANIDSPDFGQAQADLRRAESAVRLSEKTLARTRELYAHGTAARKDVESAEADHESNQAERERAEAHLALLGGVSASVDQHYTLRAPIDEIVVEKNINPGQELLTDQVQAQFVISQPKQLWVLLDITEKDVALVKPGQNLVVSTQAYPGKKFGAKIDVVGDSLYPSTRTVKVRGTVDNPEKLLKAEMYVAVDVSCGSDAIQGVTVPSRAIFMKDNKHYAFVAENKTTFGRREVSTGPEYDEQIVVLNGLPENASVVTSGCLLLESLIEAKDNS